MKTEIRKNDKRTRKKIGGSLNCEKQKWFAVGNKIKGPFDL